LLDPQLADAYRARADLYWVRSDVQAALTDYEQALTLNSRDALAYQGRGRVWSARRETRRALADFTEAIRLQPDLASVYLDRAAVYLRNQEMDRALADGREAMQRRPQLAGELLALVERRAAELAQGTEAEQRQGCELCRQTLRILQPVLKERQDIQKLIHDGLNTAPDDKDPGACARRLRELLAAVRGRL
jgi:tetratricopeptide (TPR) repeat protein